MFVFALAHREKFCQRTAACELTPMRLQCCSIHGVSDSCEAAVTRLLATKHSCSHAGRLSAHELLKMRLNG